MKKLVIFLFVGVLMVPVTGSSAQELLVPPTSGQPGPPQLEVPLNPQGSGSRGSLPGIELPGSEGLGTPRSNSHLSPEPISSGDLQPGGISLFTRGGDDRVFDCEPALLESTGTWLRRGFWYAEVDAVVMDRVWRRDNFILMLQPDPNNTGEFGAENALLVEGGRTGAEAAPRLKVGRFLFRDHDNRDHTLEFVGYGGGQWTTGGRLDAATGGSLNVGAYNIVESDIGFNVVRFPLDRGNLSFDGATSTQYEYNSRFNNFELNYHMKSRMRKDRMELEPSGHWVRRAQPTISRSLMAGVRYFDLNEDFDWDAFGINIPSTVAAESETGNYNVKTDNDLIGTQLGFTWGYETARWSLALSNKSGMYWNHTDVESRFSVSGTDGVIGDNDISVDNLSFIIEGALVGKWHLRPNLSLRAGFEILYVSSVAHAAEQMNFIPVQTADSSIVNGNSTFMGGVLGFERYW